LDCGYVEYFWIIYSNNNNFRLLAIELFSAKGEVFKCVGERQNRMKLITKAPI